MPVNAPFPASIVHCESLEQFFAAKEMRAGEVSAFLLEHEERLEDAELKSLASWSDEDRARMGEFQDQRGRTSWCMSRFVFRNVMSRALGVDCSELTLETGPFGKPYLPDSRIAFNWAHTVGCLLFAVSSRQEVGCDIEDSVRRRDAFRDIARDYFSPAEQRWIDEEARRLNKTTKVYRENRLQGEYHESVRLYEPEEMEQLFAAHGMIIQQFYGDYDGSPLSPAKPRMIAVGIKG